jgi:predicted nuclease of predicted toxin-antitoxin system
MRFLLDETVRAELDGFLREEGFHTRRLPKGAPDRALAAASKEEKRLIVTNDEDFASFPLGKVYGVLQLRVPQRDARALLSAFQRVLRACKKWAGHVVEAGPERWRASLLASKRAGPRAK